MAEIYPVESKQNVRVLNDKGKTKTRLVQKVTMVNTPSNEGVQTLFDLTTKPEGKEASSVMSIYSKESESKEKSYFVKLGSLDQFLDESGQLLEADETLKALLSGDGLEISPDSNAISITKSKEQIIITVDAKDKKPYTITATPTSISLDYGEGDEKVKYVYSTKDERCIDIALNRSVVDGILSSKKGESIFSTISSVYTLPANIIGEYFCGMEANSTVEYNGITLTKLDFGAGTPPCCFIKQKNSKGEEVRYFYIEGQMVACSKNLTFLYEKDDKGVYHYTMHLGTSSDTKYSYQIPVPISAEGVVSPQFAEAYQLLTNNSDLNFDLEDAQERDNLRPITIPVAGENIVVKSKQHDGRPSNPVAFTINDRRMTIQETISVDPHKSREDDPGIVQKPKDKEREDEPDDGGEGGGDDDTKPKPEDDKKVKKDEEKKNLEKLIAEEKAENDKNNKAFKDTMKTVNNVMGETLSTIGIWLMVCSLIPGVGLLAMIPGAIIAGIGLIQTTFADQLVFSPFRRIKHKLAEYEAEQAEEFETRDQFLENERELDNLEKSSKDRIDVLDKMHNRELSDNAFARDFAALYNTNGVGIAEPTEGSSNIHDLCSLENLDTRLAMAMSLDQISKTADPKTRQALIEDFTTSYFANLSADQRTSVEGLFSPDNNENLRNYVAALNEANSAQVKERTLYESQREVIKSADTYRLNYLAGTDKMTEEQRIAFFERYSTDIIQNAVLAHDGTTEVINQIIEKVPEESRDQVVTILNDAAAQINTDLEIIDKEAEENVEEHKKVGLLQEFKDSVDEIAANKDKVTTVDSCVSASETYLKTYSLAYYEGYAKKLEDNVTKDSPASVTGTIEKNVLAGVNEALTMLKPDKPSSEMAAVDSALSESGYIGRVTNFYTNASGTGASILGDGGLLADPSARKLEKNHTLYAVADNFAKNDLITFMTTQAEGIEGVKPEVLRDTLSKKPLSAIISEYAVSMDSDGKMSMVIDKHPIVATADPIAASAANYSIGRTNYQKAKKEQISKALSKISSPFTRKGKGTPLVQYDPDKKVYLVANYAIKASKDDKDAFKVHSEEDIVKEYTKKYPYFAALPPEMQRQVIITRLGIEGQKARLEIDREKAIEEAKEKGKEFDSTSYDAKFKVYDSAEKLTTSLLDGSFFVAYDERAYESVLDPEHKVTRNLDAVEGAGKKLSEGIEKYRNLRKILEKLPIPVEERANIEVKLGNAHALNPALDFQKALIEQIKPFMERGEVDDERIYDIIARYSDIESPSASAEEKAKKAAGFTKFCDDKNQAIDRRTSTNLTAVRARYGKGFVDREYKTRKETIEKDIKYPTTVDLLAEILYDEEANASRSPKITAASKEEFIEKLAIELNQTKPKDRESYIMSLLSKDYQKEYKQAKMHVLDELPSEENIEYFKANRDDREFDINRGKYRTDIDALFTGRVKSEDLAKTIKNINKELAATGIDEKIVDKLTKLLENTSLSVEERQAAIEKLCKEVDKELDIQKLRLANKKGRADAAREGETEDDRKANAEKYDLQKFKDAKAKYDTTLAAIENYLAKNPDYPYGNEILNGFINGDVSYFIANPEDVPEGIEIGNDDLYMFEILGISSDIKEMDKQLNESIDDKFTPEDAAKIRKERLQDSLKKARDLQKRIEISEKRLEDKQKHADAARDGNSTAERQTSADNDNFERYEAAQKEFEAKLKIIEEFIEEHPDYQYASELINAFIEGDGAFFETHKADLPKDLKIGNLDKYLFEKLGIGKDIKSLKQKTREKTSAIGLTPEAAKAAINKAIKENKKILKKFKKRREALVKKVKEKRDRLEIIAENSKQAVVRTTGTETDLSKAKRSETLTKISGISKFLAKLKGDREAAAEARAEVEAETVEPEVAPTAPVVETDEPAATADDELGREGE